MRCRAALALLLALSRAAGAQEKTPIPQGSPITDMIESAKNALNNLRYAQARKAAREVLALGRLKRTQEIAALQVAAAAYFPEDSVARMPDSAAFYLKRLARLMPAGQLPLDVASPGLDSQLVLARLSTFGASIHSPLELTLKGAESRAAIDVMSTHAARWQLYLRSGDGGPVVLLDTLGAVTNGKLSLQAHSGFAPIIRPGNFQLTVLSISTLRPDTIALRLDGVATGAPPSLVDMPAPLDPARILPERASQAIGAGIAGAVIVGGLTWALANSVRPPHALGKEPTDSRGTVVAFGIAVGALAGGFLDRGKELPENVKKNAVLEAGYLKLVGDATETNRRRVSEYKLGVAIDPEIK